MKQLYEQLVAALSWYGVEADLPQPEPADYVGWEVSFVVTTNRYTNSKGLRELLLKAWFTSNGKWLFIIGPGAYQIAENKPNFITAAEEAAALPNNNAAWLTDYEVDGQQRKVGLSVRTCVAGTGCLRNAVQHLLDDLINSADHYHDLMQIAVQQGRCIPQLVQDSGYVAALVEAAESEDEEEHEDDDEEDADEDQDDNDDEDQEDEDDEPEEEVEEEPSNFQPPPTPRRRQLPWE
jgi:hypothetical protein